ncbi:MAG: DUF393 domain-containing protein [Phycisphaeraceae bacterium]|nr:DUF393 domain-containing protein [Phycisphaeraceae bacterium]MCW5753762.1 DUF393 domain-containing protein [Phycisphaeraceae bacterium]
MAEPAIKVLVDLSCPMCRREAALWRRLDRGRGRIALVDIAATGFDASDYGCTQAGLMASIHGVLADGRVIEGMEVFRRAYGAVGLGWLLAPTAWPGVRRVADAAYRAFAKRRLRWSGWCRENGCAVPQQGGQSFLR